MARLGLLPDINEIINENKNGVSNKLYWENWFKQLQDLVNNGQGVEDIKEIDPAIGIKFDSPIRTFLLRIISNNLGNCNIAANPQILSIAKPTTDVAMDGQEITIEGSDNIRTVTLSNGRGLQLSGGAPITLKNGDIIKLHYNRIRNIWIENYRSINHV